MGYLIKFVKMVRLYWKYFIIAVFFMFVIIVLNFFGLWFVRDLIGIIIFIGKYLNVRRMIINIFFILILFYILRIVF